MRALFSSTIPHSRGFWQNGSTLGRLYRTEPCLESSSVHDACVLYSAPLRDLPMRLALAHLSQVRDWGHQVRYPA